MDEDLLLATFGRALRVRRRALDLTLRDVSERTGLSHRHIGEIERGRRGVRLTTLLRLAYALETTGGDLVTLVEVSLVVAQNTGHGAHTTRAQSAPKLRWARQATGIGVQRAPITRRTA